MKLTKSQEENVKVLLSNLSAADVIALARTITVNAIKVHDCDEAVNAIILHEKDVQSLLLRKKITREVLLKFLNKKKIEICGYCDKGQLVTKVLEIFHDTLNKGTSTPSDAAQTKPVLYDDSELREMATEFSKWFYGMLNGENLVKVHFWHDCQMGVLMTSPNQNVSMSANDDTSAVKLFQDIKSEYKLYFNPNLAGGVDAKANAHGLVVVFVCGTLHQVSNCVGVFEQAFGLIRDPFMENNWRIKYTKLVVQSKDVQAPPVINEETYQKLSVP